MTYTIVAIVPPKEHEGFEVFNNIYCLQKSFNEKYGCTDALHYPPHITLKSLGAVKEENLGTVYQRIAGVAQKMQPFQIGVNGIRFFGTNKDYIGVYFNLEDSRELKNLHRMLVGKLKEFEDKKPRQHKELGNYNPHITLVGTDICQAAYEEAKKDIRESNLVPRFSFNADNLSVLQKEEKSGKYKAAHKFKMGDG